MHLPHADSTYETTIRENVARFHRNFNERAFEKNGALVADTLEVQSNGKAIHGRDAFVKQIARFVTPFPDVKITDLDTVVDGNLAAIRFEVTGTHHGDLETPEGVLAPTHRAFRIDGSEHFTFDEAGKLVRLVTIEDLAGLLRQLKGK